MEDVRLTSTVETLSCSMKINHEDIYTMINLSC